MKSMRVSTADRDRYYSILKRAYAEGRIDSEELDLRLAQVGISATYGELDQIVADLPRLPDRKYQMARRGLLIAAATAAAGAVAAWYLWPETDSTDPAQVDGPAPQPTGPTLEAAANPTVGPIEGSVTSDAGKMLVTALTWLETHGYTQILRAHFNGGAILAFSARYRRLDDASLEDYIAFTDRTDLKEYASGLADPSAELIDVDVLKRMNIDGMQQLAIETLRGTEIKRIDFWPNRVNVEVAGDDYGRGAGSVTFDASGHELIAVGD